MDLFDTMNTNKKQPLAMRLRPKTLETFFGQKHLINKDSLLSRAIRANCLGNCIFYGPPGTGKTTLANIIANICKGNFVRLNAINSGVSDAKKVIDDARNNMKMYGTKTYLLLDECHRWSKSQSDSILEAMEDGSIVFIGATTENPYFSMTRAIVSRCTIYEFKPLTKEEIKEILQNALIDKENGFGSMNIKIEDDALVHISTIVGGDVRSALNALELAVLSTPINKDGQIYIDLKTAENSIQKKALSIDENMFYDMLSAFCKSLRGSDAEGALYYSNLLIESGCDPLTIARRLVVHSAEDVGLADPFALVISNTALQVLKDLGLPEGNIPLCEAIIYVCEAPKSNSTIVAINNAKNDIKKFGTLEVPSHLKNNDNLQSENPKGYKYPHNFGGYVKQQYLPDKLKNNIYYIPSKNGQENGVVRKKLI